jgi:hypothetical protein
MRRQQQIGRGPTHQTAMTINHQGTEPRPFVLLPPPMLVLPMSIQYGFLPIDPSQHIRRQQARWEQQIRLQQRAEINQQIRMQQQAEINQQIRLQDQLERDDQTILDDIDKIREEQNNSDQGVMIDPQTRMNMEQETQDQQTDWDRRIFRPFPALLITTNPPPQIDGQEQASTSMAQSAMSAALNDGDVVPPSFEGWPQNGRDDSVTVGRKQNQDRKK